MSALIAEWQARKAEETEELYDRLMTALTAGRVDLVTDARMLDHSGSPVHSPWDHLAPLLGLMLLAMAVLLSAGMAFGIVAMFFCAVIHLLGNRYFVAWRIQQRTLMFVRYSMAHWQAVWEAGGLAIVVKGSGELACFAPTGDWRKFVRRLIPLESPQPAMQPAPRPAVQPAVQAAPAPPAPPPAPLPEALPEALFEEHESPPTLPPEFGATGRLELEG